MKSLLQILLVNAPKTIPSRTPGQAGFEAQDAECIILNDDGTPSQVGVLRVPKELRGVVKPGIFHGTFALGVSYKNRTVEAQLTGLSEVKLTPKGPVAVTAPGA